MAGKQAGGDENSGTRSSLMYETLRIVEQIKPKYVLWENVKNILSQKHRHNFDKYLEKMQELGYKNYYQVLNAKDYGIPQNRERVFTISIKEDLDFEFPPKEELKLKLKDMLENTVDEKYYISENQLENLIKIENENAFGFIKKSENGKQHQSNTVYNELGLARTLTASDYKSPMMVEKCIQVGNLIGGKWDKINECCTRVYSEDGLSPTIHTCQGGNTEPKIAIKNATKKGYDEAIDGDSINLQYSNSTTRRGRVGHQVSQTLMANDNMGVIENLKIRKLTPKECWRLMGFSDEDFEKAEAIPTSNTQLYKQAGNSIVVTVLEKIFKNLFFSNVNKVQRGVKNYMEIHNKFYIDERVWVIYETNGEIRVYDDFIDEICIKKDEIYYILKESCIDKKEENLVLFDDKEGLFTKITEAMQEIRRKEKGENEYIKQMELPETSI